MHDVTAHPVQSDAGSNQPAQGSSQELGTVPLVAEQHATADFASRSDRVQKFIRTDCWPLIATNYTRVFVWPSPEGRSILGFYSLSSFSVERNELNNRHQRKAPGGIPAPMALIGYMGKSQDAPPGFGGVLIADAAKRASLIKDVAMWGLCLHPENESLATWYGKLGFTRARSGALFMYAPFSALLEPKS